MKRFLDELKCQYCAKGLGDIIRSDYGHAEIICCKKEECINAFKEEFRSQK